MVRGLGPLVLTVLLVACGGAGQGAQERSEAPDRPKWSATAIEREIDLDAVPPVDTSNASVPLQEVVFDTFDGSFVRLSNASEARIRALRDAIEPIYNPGYGSRGALPWLAGSDLVLGYISESGVPYAYPLKILNFRELVNDEIDGVPILVSYCPLCASGVAYSREVEGRTLLFGNTSALYQSDLVMFDHETGSYWFQVRGAAIVGELTGARLGVLPSMTLPWGDWKRLHPDTRLLASDGGQSFDERFAQNPFASYPQAIDEERFAFPVSKDQLDGRLPASEVVVTVEAGNAIKAYPARVIGDAAVNDEVGGEPVVVFSRAAGFATAFRPLSSGRRLTFSFVEGTFRDTETGSTWDEAGQAVAGALEGAVLEPLPTRRAFWFSIASSTPGLELHR